MKRADPLPRAPDLSLRDTQQVRNLRLNLRLSPAALLDDEIGGHCGQGMQLVEHRPQSSLVVACQSQGTTPLPASWDHLAPPVPADAMIPAAGGQCQAGGRRDLAGGGSAGGPPMLGFSC